MNPVVLSVGSSCNKIAIYNVEIPYVEVLYIIGKHLFDYETYLFSGHLVPYFTSVDAINYINQEHYFLSSIK